MEEKERGTSGKSRLAESINPEIGNGSAWEINPHFASLRSVDPTKSLESLLYSPSELQKLADEKIAVVEISPLEEDAPLKKNVKKHKPKHKKKDKKEKAFVTPDDDLGEKEKLKDVVADQGEEKTIQPLQSDSTEPTTISSKEKLPAEGKRVKKIIKAAEEERGTVPVVTTISESSTETTLSPFTYWLKNLRGSEYVHPYNDDYALDQLSNSTKGGISETFAELLAGQGYRDQAIEMYKLLMARFPEKSSFFAAKIEALK